MGARQESVEETRQKITLATMALHERVGPRHTTVSAVAEAAGVTRLTVYRHFADDAALVAACSAHWSTLHPRPDVARWESVADPIERLRSALAETYAWARTAEPMMTMIYRDLDVLPAFVAEFLSEDEERRVDAVLRPFGTNGDQRRMLTAVITHALDIHTWRSLCRRGGLSDGEAVGAMEATVAMVLRK
jgi:AcrR family transcriptional regulator